MSQLLFKHGSRPWDHASISQYSTVVLLRAQWQPTSSLCCRARWLTPMTGSFLGLGEDGVEGEEEDAGDEEYTSAVVDTLGPIRFTFRWSNSARTKWVVA